MGKAAFIFSMIIVLLILSLIGFLIYREVTSYQNLNLLEEKYGYNKIDLRVFHRVYGVGYDELIGSPMLRKQFDYFITSSDYSILSDLKKHKEAEGMNSSVISSAMVGGMVGGMLTPKN